FVAVAGSGCAATVGKAAVAAGGYRGRALASVPGGAMAGTEEQVRVGFFPTTGPVGEAGACGAYRARTHDAGIDHVCCGDHVSFFVGVGLDGLIQATTLAMLHPTLPVMTGVYLLPLRHPVLVARQLSDLDQLAPGRLVFGVGIGGEDRHEVEICGVEPSPRGRRLEASLTVLRQPLGGAPPTFHGEFFELDDALVLPAPARPVPIIVGGRSDAAARRAGRLGDGWLGIWNSARRFRDVVDMAGAEAAPARRPDPPTPDAQHLRRGVADTNEDT